MITNKQVKTLLKSFSFASFLVASSFSSLNAASYPPLKDRTGNGLVVTSHPQATEVGQNILENGGNAIDAAVAVGYALAVTHPAAGNIGGGGFALIHLKNGETVALDFREKAPLKSHRDMYLDENKEVIPFASTVGYLAAGVPGTVKGMSAMLDKYGTMKLGDLIAPSVKLAEEGFTLTDRQEETMADARENFLKFKSSTKYFLKSDKSTYKSGEKLVQKDLAKTLKLIQKDGPSAFYEGKIADLIEADMKKNGGIITKEDLKNYDVIWQEPIKGTYRGYDILSMPPVSSGGAHIIQILNVMENADISKMGFGSSKTIHLMASAMRQAYADRSVFMGDPNFVDVPLDKIISKEYAKKIYNSIDKFKTTPSSEITAGLDYIKQGNAKNLKEGDHTTHYSVVDKWGNAVSVTYTVNGYYGAYAAVDGAGFLLNNEMDDFSIKPGVANLFGLVGGDANAIAPNKRPLSSMSPTIVLKDDELFMVVGSPGGARIITTVLQVISNVIDHGMDISQAVSAPRFHMQWLPDELRVEKFGINKDTKDALTRMGYAIKELPDMGDVNAILRNTDTKEIFGVKDPRTEF